MFPVTFLVEISGIEPLTCGDKRDRTADLLNAIQALSQLSYTPKKHLKLYYPHPSIVNTEFQEVVDILLYFH